MSHTSQPTDDNQRPMRPPSPWSRAVPWLAGAGIALGHIAVSSQCTLPREGRCSTCGSCVVALTALVGWAVWQRRHAAESEQG